MQRFETLCCLSTQVLGLQVATTYLAYEQGPRFRGPSLFSSLINEWLLRKPLQWHLLHSH